MVIFYKKWKKYNDIQFTKKNGLGQSKNKKSSTLPAKQQGHYITKLTLQLEFNHCPPWSASSGNR